MGVGAYAIGLAALAAAMLPLWIGARAVRARIVPFCPVATAVLVDAVLVLGAMTLLAELLGAAGALERVPLVTAALLVGAGAWAWARGNPSSSASSGRWPQAVSADRLLVAAAMVAALLVLAQWGVAGWASLEHGMLMPDTMYYHLPLAAWFAQGGSLMQVNFVGVDHLSTPTFYPGGVELLHAVGMVLLGRDVLSPFLNTGFVALALLAGWCIGDTRGAGPAGLVGVGLAVSFPILWRVNAGQAGTDAAAVALFLGAAALLAAGQFRGVWIVLAGIAGGLALGVKLTLLAPVLALSVAVVFLARRSGRGRAAVAWGAPLLALGGFWLLRNLLEAGSPLPWLDIHVGPLDYSAPARSQSEGLEFSIFHYATDLAVWRDHFLPDLEPALGWVWPALMTLAGAGLVSAVASRVPWQRALGFVGAFAVAAYLLTPNGAAGPENEPWAFGLNLRFAAPALALALALLAVAPWLRTPSRQRILLAVLLATLVANLLHRMGVAPERRLDALVIAGALATLAGAGLVLRRADRRLALMGVTGVALAFAAGGWFVQRDYLRDRYASLAPNLPPADVWARKVSDARIGVVGFVPQYPLFGVDLSNRVESVARHGPRGSIERYRSCQVWRRAVNEGGYRYLVLARIPSPNPGYPPPQPRLPEAAWTASDPAARELLSDRHSRVFRLKARMNPAGCAPKPRGQP